MNRLSRRLVTLLILSALCLAVGITLVAAQGPDNPVPTPQPEVEDARPTDVTATPVGDSAVVVVWQTAQAVAGWIEYGPSLDKLDGVAFDDRGKDVADTQHQVTVKALEPGTGYYYTIVSGGKKYDNAGSLFKVLTGGETKLLGLPEETAELAQPSGTPQFLTLPFLRDQEMQIQQGWTSSHQGIDYIKGTLNNSPTWRTFLILAAADGQACGNCVTGPGNKVWIRHTVNGVIYYTYYGHLGSIESQIPLGNQNSTVFVRRGQVIGTAGDTGTNQGWVHLHFGLKTAANAWVNPYSGYWTTDPPSYSLPSDTNDGRMISSGQSLNGTINPADDEDTYYFNASQGQLATIRMDRQNTTLDSYLYLYAPNGSLVNNPAADDDRGGNRNALIDHLTLPTTGRYLIRAKSWNGSSSGPYSLSLTIEASGGPPAAPSNLSATVASSSQINLSWQDNSNNETGFKVERKTGAGGTWNEIATVGTGVRTYQNTGLAANTTYYYRVRAYNSYGNSAYSNEAGATTPNITCPVYRAAYYDNRNLSGSPKFIQCEDWPINHDWGSGGPGNGVGNDNFSARWTGRASIAAGTYTFIAGADDGIKVWLDGQVIINEWRDQGYTEYRVNRSFSNSGYHDIQVEYYENGGAARVFFKWEQAQPQAQNLALNKPTSATSWESGQYVPFKGTDGRLDTRWSSSISSSLGPQWFKVDLGSRQTFNRFVVRWEAAYAAHYWMAWSDDGVNYSGYQRTLNSPQTDSYTFPPQTHRYVAIYMDQRAPRMNNYSLWEFEVYNVAGVQTTEAEDQPLLLPALPEPLPGLTPNSSP